MLFESASESKRSLRSALVEVTDIFGDEVMNKLIVIITKRNAMTAYSVQTFIENECENLKLKYMYFDTQHEFYSVPPENLKS